MALTFKVGEVEFNVSRSLKNGKFYFAFVDTDMETTNEVLINPAGFRVTGGPPLLTIESKTQDTSEASGD